MGWLSLFSSTGKGLLALLLLSFSFAAQAKDKPFYASKDYFHWADLTNTWDNGNLSKNKSAYKEGDVVPHAYVPENLQTGQSYSILLKYDYLLSTKDAGGFTALVWDPALFAEAPTGQLGEGSITGSNKNEVVGPYFATNLTITSAVAKPDETSGNTTLKVWEITFTYNGTTGSDAALYFGLRLAQIGEIAANGAAAWSGASLQTYLDPSSDPGTRSLQIDPGAIQSACPNPPTVDAGTYGPLCTNGSPIALVGTPAGGTWSGTGVSGDQANGFTFNPSAGTQTLVYTYTDGNGCSNSDETTITVNDPPTVSAGTYGPLCTNGSAITLGGTPAGGVWTGTGVSGSQGAGFTFDPSAGTQTLTYSYTDPNTGCSASAQVTITVNNPPVITMPSFDAICSNAGSTINLSDASGLSPAGGTWSGQGVSLNGSDYVFNPAGLSGSIQLTYSYTDPNTGCSSSSTVNIVVNDPPTVSAGTYGPLCTNGSAITLGGTPAGGVWTGTGVSGSQGAGFTFDPSAGTQTLTYSYTDPNTGCSASAQVTITVNEPPVVSAGSYGPLCTNGGLTNLVGSPAGGTWSGTGVSGDQANGYTFDPSVGTQTLTYSYTDPNTGCSNSATTRISVNPPPPCGFVQTAPLLEGNPVIPTVGQAMKFKAEHDGYTYEWSVSSVGNTANASVVNGTANAQEVEVAATAAGTFTLVLKVTDATTGCSTTCQQTITVAPSGPFTTYTKGFWGTAGGAFCGGSGSNKTAVLDWMRSVVPDAGVTFGSGQYSFILEKSAFNNTGSNTKPKAQIWQLLPGGSTPSRLTCNATSGSTATWNCVPIETSTKSPNYGSIKNNLLAQGIAMFFNLAYDENLGDAVLYGNKLTFTGTACAGGTVTTQTIPSCVFNAAKTLNGGTVTVQSIYDVAMKVLGADPSYSSISAADATAALNALNVGFDKGANITGVEMDNTPCSSTSYVVTRSTNSEVEAAAATKLAVSAYPNPFTDRIRFTIQSPKAGRATLEVYNLLGQKVGVPFEGQLNAGETRNVEYTAPVNHRSSLIYMLRMHGEQISGKLMGTRQ